MVISPTDRVATILARDERLIDVFTAAAPAFERLRNPVMRRTMARLVTVEQAARIAGIDATSLVEQLNRAARGEPAAVDDGRVDGAGAPPCVREPRPVPAREPEAPEPCVATTLRALADSEIVDLDVRDDLRAGREPFGRIMAARRAMSAGSVLRVRAIFEPVPLYAVMAKQGLEHVTERLADDDWRVWFHEPEPGTTAGEADTTTAPPAGLPVDAVDSGVVVLDVRGLEPPEPMLRTLAALDRLPAGGTLVQLNVRVPQFLLPQLDERGLEWEIREQSSELVRLLIRRPAGPTPMNPA